MRKKNLTLFAYFILAVFAAAPSFANSIAEYEARRQAYLASAAPANNDNSLIMQAYLGLQLNPDALDRSLRKIISKDKADFHINKLVRVLFYTEDSQDKILNIFQQLPFFLTQGELKNQYWSENHMILWMSSAWLLHEKFGWELSDPTLHDRLLHFLNLKVKYGFYEFFSPTYFPYLLSGLLNLADFSTDEEIKALAQQAAQRLIKECLLFVNDKGVFFPASGRSYAAKYTNAYDHNHARLIYLITGLGKKQDTSSHIGGFIATTDLNMSGIINTFQTNLDTVIHNGHPLSTHVHASLSRFDRTMFQWSSGEYFHPDRVKDTTWLINTMNLWDHEAFNQHSEIAKMPEWIAKFGASQMGSITRSSVISDSYVALYKDHGTTLSSIQDFWKGRQGYQQWPWVATIDDVAVWTQSGEVKKNWRDRSRTLANASLPYVKQKNNMILIMYKANVDLKLIARKNHSVSLYWPTDFDETIEKGRWIMGRRGSSYIAVYRHCTGKINGFYACDDQDGQTWAAIVGNASTHGNFAAFVDDSTHATIEEKWTWNPKRFAYDYYGKIKYHDKKIEKTWH